MRHSTFLFSVLLFSIVAVGQSNFRCFDVNHVAVTAVARENFGDSAKATIEYGRPVILYSPMLLGSMPPQVAIFAYAHECGHHALGHVFRGVVFGAPDSVFVEQQADCWGIVTAVKQGLLDDDDVTVVQESFKGNPGDFFHFPGPARAFNLRRCLADAHTIPRKSTDGSSSANSDDDKKTDTSSEKTSTSSKESERRECRDKYSDCIEAIKGAERCIENNVRNCTKACAPNPWRCPDGCDESRFSGTCHEIESYDRQRCREKRDDCLKAVDNEDQD